MSLCSLLPATLAAATTRDADWAQLAADLDALASAADEQGVRLAIGVEDVSGAGSGNRLLSGSAESYHPASTIKMLLITALMLRVDAGELALSGTATVSQHDIVGGFGVLQHEAVPQQVSLARLAELTVTVSDNTATNVLVDVVGYDSMRALAQSLDMQTMHFGRKMFEAASSPDRDNHIDAADSLTLLSAIYGDHLLSSASRQQILDWMAAQTVTSKIGAGVPSGAPVAHKTGENGPVSHDIGYLLVPGREMAIAIFAEVLGDTNFEMAQARANPLVAGVAARIYDFAVRP